ncbi:Predicted oxidoreductase [Flexibacter flexilis DSM 6793]|uniref:Predicted oxidoreductase n=1 Tax=Flexibacter flexilis DSM 6793 TaxID=927664 RepID=A0A1I1DSC6_9BACT|nr:aldo/keto reductase [Flexibacter flexilis]SFB75948.1 Predicted oxidoreductase [Flexibacter flexilis DSM 6793]
MTKIPKIALGTWSWGAGFAGSDQVFGNNLSVEELQPVFKTAIESGLNLWDTALVYGMGSSEKALGEFVKQYPREELILSTKFTPQLAKEVENPIEEMLNSSLDNLGTDFVDFYWIHNPVGAPNWVAGMIPLLKSGKIKQIGVSNHNLAQIKEANDILATEGFKISAVQNHYSLLYRFSEDTGILDYCNENGIIFFSYMVLEQGALSGNYNTQNPLPENSDRGKIYNKILPQLEELMNAIREIGDSKNASVAQIVMAWAIAKNTLPIIGVTKIKQVEDAVKATTILLSQEEMERIEILAAQANVDTKASWEKLMS